jgi:hypothetical protein
MRPNVTDELAATRAQLQATSPSPPRADRLPSRPMDSRVFSIEVLGGVGPPRPLSRIPGGPPGGLFYITVPLRDLSIVNYGPGGAAGVEGGARGRFPWSLRWYRPTTERAEYLYGINR